MSVTLHLMRTTSDEKTLFKNYTEYRNELSGFLRDGTSILNPVIAVDTRNYQLTDVAKWNYAYIADFHRYYFIDDIVSLRTDLWEFHMRIDVLGSWYKEIETLEAIISRCEASAYQNPLLIDDKIPVNNNKVIDYQSFSNLTNPYTFQLDTGHSNGWNFILTCVNGVSSTIDSSTAIDTIPFSTVTPTASSQGVNPMIAKYILSADNVFTLANQLNNVSIVGALDDLFGSKIEYIVALTAYPMNLANVFGLSGTQPTATAYLCRSGIIENVYDITGKRMPIISVGRTKIETYFDDFRDYPPYSKWTIYIPYVGYKELDFTELYGKYLRLEYAIDYASGNGTAFLIRQNGLTPANSDICVASYDCKIGISIPINSLNVGETFKSVVSSLTTIVSGAISLSGNVGSLPVVNAGLNSIGNIHQPSMLQRGGSNSVSMSTFNQPRYPFFVVERPNAVYPMNYEHYVGKPSMKSITLSTIKNSGFVQVADIHIEGSAFQDCTMTERQEIERLLKEGVIFNDDTN